MSEMTLSNETRNLPYHIADPELEDAAAIGPMHLQSWIETYQNPELGVDEAWIRKHRGFSVEEEGQKRREALIKRVLDRDPTVFYKVAKDSDEEIVGFVIATKNPGQPHELDSLFTLKRVHGSGLGAELMEQALEWLGDDEPVRLVVVDYNERAKRFYEKYGFNLTGKREPYIEPVEDVEMVRL